MAKTAAAQAGSHSGERILRAALETFAEKGFDGATTREIAARADVNLGLLQYYFGAKPRLWQAAVDRAFDEFRPALDEVMQDPTPNDDRERLRLLIRLQIRLVASRPAFVRLMHDEGKRRGPRMRWLVDRHVKPMFSAFRGLVERMQGEGLLPADIAPAHFVYILIGAVDLIFHQAEECKRVAGFDPSEPAAVEAHARAVEHFLLGPTPQETSA